MAAKKESRLTPEGLLADFAPEIVATAKALRQLVRETVPEALERAYPGWRAIGYRTKAAGYFAGIFPAADRVKLLFEHGHVLPDPLRLLEGETRQTRHVTLTDSGDMPVAALRDLISASVAFGESRHPGVGKVRPRSL